MFGTAESFAAAHHRWFDSYMALPRQQRPLNYGVPERMARAVSNMFHRDGMDAHARKVEVIDALLCDDSRIPLATDQGDTTGEAAIHRAAESAARDCYTICKQVHTENAAQIAIGMMCRRQGVPVPLGETLAEIVARAVDKAWWRRVLRTEYMRRFEHTAIQLGLTYVKSDPYVSRETAIAQAKRNHENQKLLESRTATNENGQSFTVAELAARGTANKTIRRGELMLRIRGFEEIADARGDVGMFWTVTCPSKFHSVGGTNRKYSGATPRDAQAYLVGVWARIRAALHRAGIRPYGFRIAEPHSDGCPHWHMLLFVDKASVNDMEMIVTAYAMQEDEDEAGAQKNRVKLVQIEAGKGTAAGYIAKYVSKNIDGAGVGDHKTFEDGRTYVVSTDLLGGTEITPSQRVTYWSQVWGIRQFQQIGGAPVGVWRELRRVPAELVASAPDAIRLAHAACQKIECADAAGAKQADFAAYVMAQGGPLIGRRMAIKVAAREITVDGRYGSYAAEKPVGVYLVAQPEAVYESVRHTWTVEGKQGAAVFAVPRTGVNNCTAGGAKARQDFQDLQDSWGGPSWVNPAKAYRWSARQVRKVISAPENPIGNFDRQEKFMKHRRAGPVSHLEHLQRKYGDHHA